MSDTQERTLFDAAQVQEMVTGLGEKLAGDRSSDQLPTLVGIRTGGANLALRLESVMAEACGQTPDLGLMDITLYRDDWTNLHHRPKVGKTEIDFSIADRTVVLVDDVMFTGRTVRAALDALIDLGRPRRIVLLVLVDRGHRELPIQPDYVGAVVQTAKEEVVDVILGAAPGPEDRVVLRPSHK